MTPRQRMPIWLVVLLVSCALLEAVAAAKKATSPDATTTTRTTDFIDCNQPCNGGDVNYELTASVRIMKLMNYTYRGRTYSTPDSDSFMGPTMRVKPGQSLWIKLINNLTDAPGAKEVSVYDYWKMLQNPGEKIKYQYYKKAVDSPSKMIVDEPNIPSHFDATNLHLHGLDIAVHMFDPVGTANPKAPHIAIDPEECYCYRFDIPDHHPSGMYWYHPHLHGSTALQLWGGMLGLLYVDGPLEDELQDYGVTQSYEFVIWDPALKQVSEATHNLEVDDFLMGQTTLSKVHPFLVNGQYMPHLATVQQHDVLHLRVLAATIENENTFLVYPKGRENEPWDDVALPFWVIGSDGVMYHQPKRNHILVLAGGQREEILIQFDEPGEYVISQQGIQGMQFFDMYGHPHDQILATITVMPKEGDDSTSTTTTVPIEDMTFTPGYQEEETIQAHDIVASETIVFSMGADRNQAPFPQYYVNGKPFDPDRLDFHAQPGEAREYLLVNANHNVHPFHIHVNRFQVQEMGSELSTTKYPVLKAVLENFDPNVWRDTVIVPPNGRTRIWVQYKKYTGKTVFHCHFLAHEDSGMMSTLFIGPHIWPSWWEYYWHESHREQLVMIGLGLGAFVASLAMFLVWKLTARRDATKYQVVETMNELKSKARD